MIIAAVLTNRGNDSDAEADDLRTVTPTATVDASATASPSASVTAKSFAAAEQVVDPAKQYTATIKTSKGDIVIQLYADKAPKTVNSFVFLAQKGYFDGISRPSRGNLEPHHGPVTHGRKPPAARVHHTPTSRTRNRTSAGLDSRWPKLAQAYGFGEPILHQPEGQALPGLRQYAARNILPVWRSDSREWTSSTRMPLRPASH
ncbi:MAG: peptidylprolyl isomerase [Dehalococcoidia bacterium]|nr:peptidylprolyl isomerase [Dehalococcoidia bacterium]